MTIAAIASSSRVERPKPGHNGELLRDKTVPATLCDREMFEGRRGQQKNKKKGEGVAQKEPTDEFHVARNRWPVYRERARNQEAF